MQGLKFKTTVKVDLSADDWQLFDQKGRVSAAKHLNKALEAAVNMEGSTPNSVWRAMNTAMSEFSHLGATDSEACRVVDHVLNKAFPEPVGVC